MKGTSFAETVLSLSKICIGAGVLALPWGLVQGRSMAMPGMVLISVWNWCARPLTMRCTVPSPRAHALLRYTSSQLLSCQRTMGVRRKEALLENPLSLADASEQRSSYSGIVHAALGRTGMLLFEGSLTAVLFGVCCSLQIQSANLVVSVFPFVPYVYFILGSAVPLVPLVLQRSLRGISWISAVALVVLLIGLSAVAFVGVVMHGVPPAPWQFSARPSAEDLSCFLGIALFAFGMQALVLPVCDGMRERERAPSALLLACSLVTGFYLVMGFGLARLFAGSAGGVQQLIILNLPDQTAVKALVCCCSALMALLSYPLMAMGVVQLLRGAGLLGAPDAEDGIRRELLLRVALLACSTGVAAVMREFGLIAAVVGCLTLVNGQLLPPLLHLRICGVDAPGKYAQHAAINGLLIVLGLAAFVFAAGELAAQVYSAPIRNTVTT